MNTNNNIYTIVYTTIIVVVVAAILAFVSQGLKDKQLANEKADTMSQMLTAAGFGTRADFEKMGNAAVLEKFAAEIGESFTIGRDGQRIADLPADKVYSAKELKAVNYLVKDKEGKPELPVFIFKNGITVVPIYGAGLWGPVWGYIAFEPDGKTIKGAYFDHESETAGLGAQIKDNPDFQAEFIGEQAAFESEKVFAIVKGGAPVDESTGKSLIDNEIDAITGATMTSGGLETAINNWLAAYAAYFLGASPANKCQCGACPCGEACECDCHCPEKTEPGCNCPDCNCKGCDGNHQECGQHEECDGDHKECEQHEGCENHKEE